MQLFFFFSETVLVYSCITLTVMLTLRELLDNIYFIFLALVEHSVDRHLEMLVLSVLFHQKKIKGKEIMRLWCQLLLSYILSRSLDTWLTKLPMSTLSPAGLHVDLYSPCLVILLLVVYPQVLGVIPKFLILWFPKILISYHYILSKVCHKHTF